MIIKQVHGEDSLSCVSTLYVFKKKILKLKKLLEDVVYKNEGANQENRHGIQDTENLRFSKILRVRMSIQRIDLWMKVNPKTSAVK